MNITVIGTGHMGAPIARALWQAGCRVTVHNRTIGKARVLADGCPGMIVAPDTATAAHDADMIILAVKPHLIIDVMHDATNVAPDATIVSLAPGIELARLESEGAVRAVRLMPNVAIAHGQGMSFICHNGAATDAADSLADSLKGTGRVAIVEERLFEPAMAVASCGIAYALRYIRAAVEGAVALGISPADATSYVTQTILGAAVLLDNADSPHPEELIDNVTTPGGSTIRGLIAMERAGFSTAVANGLLAAAGKQF